MIMVGSNNRGCVCEIPECSVIADKQIDVQFPKDSGRFALCERHLEMLDEVVVLARLSSASAAKRRSKLRRRWGWTNTLAVDGSVSGDKTWRKSRRGIGCG